jgi:hypothetical protein
MEDFRNLPYLVEGLAVAVLVSTLFTIFLVTLPTRYAGEYLAAAESKTKQYKISAQVVVLGDIGRSPRMQYHALSIAEYGGRVDLIGIKGTSHDLFNSDYHTNTVQTLLFIHQSHLRPPSPSTVSQRLPRFSTHPTAYSSSSLVRSKPCIKHIHYTAQSDTQLPHPNG